MWEYKGVRNSALAIFIISISRALKDVDTAQDFLSAYTSQLDQLRKEVPLPWGEADDLLLELCDTALRRSLLENLDADSLKKIQ